MVSFFSKKQYTAIVDKELAMKLLNERCLECSICAMFFNSSLTVSIKALSLSRILSAILIREFFMLFLTLVTSCMPLRKRLSNRPRQYIPCLHIIFLWCSSGTSPASTAPNHRRFHAWTWSGNRLNIIIEHYKFSIPITISLIINEILLLYQTHGNLIRR